VELDKVTPPPPEWRAILGVNDTDHLQRTLSTVLATTHLEAEPVEEGGVTYHTVSIPSAKPPMDIGYAFVDGYLIIGSSRDEVAEAVRQHRSGESLAKSKEFLAALPPGHLPEASALLVQNQAAMAASRFGPLAPGYAQSLAKAGSGTAPVVACVYGEEKAIRTASTSSGLDVGAALVVAAIAIPNLLRSRIAANEASAVSSVRTVNTAEITYAAMYPQRGYALSLATLGPNPHAPATISAEHAGLLSETLASESCSGDAWCTKSGYRFRVTAVCKKNVCDEYLVVATPVSNDTGVRSFCSTSDAVIHYKSEAPPALPRTASECRAWPLLE